MPDQCSHDRASFSMLPNLRGCAPPGLAEGPGSNTIRALTAGARQRDRGRGGGGRLPSWRRHPGGTAAGRGRRAATTRLNGQHSVCLKVKAILGRVLFATLRTGGRVLLGISTNRPVARPGDQADRVACCDPRVGARQAGNPRSDCVAPVGDFQGLATGRRPVGPGSSAVPGHAPTVCPPRRCVHVSIRLVIGRWRIVARRTDDVRYRVPSPGATRTSRPLPPGIK
jgi:hypothetical protein